MAGLEEVLANELNSIGAQNIAIKKRAVAFSGDLKVLYRANLELRTALRILQPIANFTARNEHDLYKKISQIDWSKYMSVDDTLAIDGTTHSTYFTHSKYAALKTKDAIVDQFRNRTGKRPNVRVHNPTLRVNLHINQDQCSVALDSSGETLHKRGYRRESGEAPMNEVLAAGMVLLSGWQADCDFIDPMCGSGTIATEAALFAYNIPPLLHRKEFGFMNWKNYQPDLWHTVVKEAKDRIRTFDYQIYASDMDFRVVSIARYNIEAAQLTDKINLKRSKLERLEASSEKGIIIINPPYDERLSTDDIGGLYDMISSHLKHNFIGYTVWIITSNNEALKRFSLKHSKKLVLYNGALECRFVQFELYAGSKKKG
ncbi:MAG: RNA methyltransferase [Saprospiraceae bacterium]|nr:MAG: RNA methyltransferase [Saprospiraceae bacterium]